MPVTHRDAPQVSEPEPTRLFRSAQNCLLDGGLAFAKQIAVHATDTWNVILDPPVNVMVAGLAITRLGEALVRVELFQFGKFNLHSGDVSEWKIDCDALTGGDIAALAAIGAAQLGPSRPFRDVIGIPRGGLRLAEAMSKYVTPEASALLIVDDVLTTGRSMREERARLNNLEIGAFGLVIFARTRAEPWVTRIFQMNAK